MKIQSLSLCAGLLAVAMAPAALAQTYTNKAQLDLAATGESFSIGQREFRLAPSAVVKAAPTAASTETDNQLIVGDYVVEVPQASTSARSKRSLDAAASGGENLAAAVSDAGSAVIVAPELNVYFTHIGAIDGLAESTGGKLLYSSAVGGKATIGYSSVAEAMQARQRILGQAGVKEVSPRLVDQRRVAW
ncbi:hypothetical protein [Pseudomonas sp. CGJS7]|uniref:hypothetical protein n=1 Tax=Pseudomonas sp. CGJS7 TaxID=3109348 RepID=UPI0030097642